MSETTCHFIGIGGIGMSALAKICLEKNLKVTGSDISKNETTELLVKKGAEIYLGHSAKHIVPNSTIIFSSSVGLENPEYKAAIDLQCRILHRSDLLVELMQGYKTLAVTGTHGKTTTTALLTTVLMEAEMNPSFAVGGVTLDLKTNGAHGKGDFFVAEADESDGTFLKYLPFGAIVTNIDFDHMDYFKTKENLFNSFKTFFSRVQSKDHLFYCGDDLALQAVSNNAGISYGFSDQNSLIIKNYRQNEWSSFFDVEFEGQKHESIEISLIGEHNALNALAVFGLCMKIGIKVDVIRKAFKSFKGVSRRAEIKGVTSGVLLLDDYAHHPTEIKATLKAIRSAVLEKRLIAIYQPHRYSRTADVLGSFKDVFDEASEFIITDIYAAGEKIIEGISHENILEELKDLNIPCRYIPRNTLAKELHSHLLPHDVVVSLGAGDITYLSQEILDECKIKPIRKMKVGLIFGGRSPEHEISIRSANYIKTCLNTEYYDLEYFGISKSGVWCSGKDLLEQYDIKQEASHSLSAEILNKINECDLGFLALHGSFGEDGTIQGFFEMLDKPYIGCDYQASAICMDKITTKELMAFNKIATSPFIHFTAWDWKKDPASILKQIADHLTFPVYVKPAHLGSSVGVTRVQHPDQINTAIESALTHDRKILVENGISGREIEFAVLGNDEPKAFPPGEIVTEGQDYTYASKYLSDDMQTKAQTDLSKKLIDEGMTLAKRAYQIAGCQGLARVDFFLDTSGKYWLNEINTIPGFTSISLYPAICAANGLKGHDLIDKLIVLALEKKRNKQKYES